MDGVIYCWTHEQVMEQLKTGKGPLVELALKGHSYRLLKILANSIKKKIHRHSHLKHPRRLTLPQDFASVSRRCEA